MITYNEWLIKEGKENKIPGGIKSKINAELSKLGKEYHQSIPVKDIEEILGKHDISFSDEGFILTGSEGRDNFDLKYQGNPVSNAMLVMTWHKMQSGRWEVIAYIS